jgi:hypothetical protein
MANSAASFVRIAILVQMRKFYKETATSFGEVNFIRFARHNHQKLIPKQMLDNLVTMEATRFLSVTFTRTNQLIIINLDRSGWAGC